VARNAVLVDDESVVEEEEDETFTIADLGSSEVEGLVPCTEGGDDEIWLLPHNLM
jgi:hypothetical protein